MKKYGIIIHSAFLILFAGMIAMQYQTYQSIQPKNFENVHAVLEHMIRMDAASEEGMMLIINHRISNYDQLTADTMELDRTYARLESYLSEFQSLKQPLEAVQASVDMQTSTIEQFKSEVGIFLNSARYISLLIHQNIVASPGQKEALLKLKGELFEYLLFPDNNILKQHIITYQKNLDFKNMNKHIDILLNYALKIHQRIDTVIGCGIPENTYALSNAYNELHNEQMKLVQQSRIQLIVTVVLLSVYLSGLLLSLLYYSRKLSDHKQVLEQELLARIDAEERYRLLIDGSSAAIMTYADHHFISANSATLNMFAIDDANEILNMSTADISPPIQADGRRSDVVAQDYIETALRDGCCSFAWLHQKKNGDVFPTHVQLTPIKLNNEVVLQAVVTDLSEMQQLRQEKMRLISALEHTVECVMITDHEAEIIYVNTAFEQLTGYLASDAVGQYASILRSDSVEDSIYINMAKMLNHGQSWHGELSIRCNDGTEILTERSISPIYDHSDKVVEHVVMFHDITAAKEQAKQLEHTQRLESLGVLAGGIAHDFNNILMAIMGNAALAERSLDVASPVKVKLAAIEQASQKAADLCQQMLAYSGKGKFVVKTVDLSKMVDGMIHLMEVSIGKSVVIKYHLEEQLPLVDVDVAQIQQIILNLITNANEAIDNKSGVISLSTGVVHADRRYLDESYCDSHALEGQFVYIEVADTGCGMDKTIQGKIFDPFFTTKFTGRGLGMSAVLGIIHGHHGALRLYSEVGKGTNFKVLLPISANAEATELLAADDSERCSTTGTILIVDDEETIREVASMILEDMGFSIMTAEDGLEGVEVYRQHQHEITTVLLDMTMPKMDGKACFRELRRINEHVQVVLSSGYSEEDITARFHGKGLAGFIQKPYTPEALQALMQKLHV